MARDSAGRRCGALGPTLNAALQRAPPPRRRALDASLELDSGLDAALSLASEGPAVARAAQGPMRRRARKLAARRRGRALRRRTAPTCSRSRSGSTARASPLAERVDAVLADLRAHPRCAQVRRVLERAPPTDLAHAVDSVRLDEPDETTTPTRDLASALPRAAPGRRPARLGHQRRRPAVQRRRRRGLPPTPTSTPRGSDRLRAHPRGALPDRAGPAGAGLARAKGASHRQRGRLGPPAQLRRHPFGAPAPRLDLADAKALCLARLEEPADAERISASLHVVIARARSQDVSSGVGRNDNQRRKRTHEEG